MMQETIDRGKKWSPLDVAKHGATALEDIAIESVGEWCGVIEDFAEGVYGELFDSGNIIKRHYQAALAELIASSLARNDPDMLLICLSRIATTQWFLRQAVKKYAEVQPNS